MPAESQLILKIKNRVIKDKGLVYKMTASNFSVLGLPDLLIFHKGKTFLLEVKAKGKKPTKIQLQRINEINKAGGLAFWTDSMEDFEAIILNLQRLCSPPKF